MKKYIKQKARIDHIAIAVKDLKEALMMYQNLFGFELVNRREIKGKFSGMNSAELCCGGFSIVLIQGTSEKSQVNQYINEYGPGVQHVAIEVDDIESLTEQLKNNGVSFSTEIITGHNLIQIFSQRDQNSGMMFELIERTESAEGFDSNSIQDLFEQLETSNSF